MITQCPACTTMFKVVPDQLRISDGWVRCGQCNEVFDANAYLQQEASESKTPEPTPPAAVEGNAGHGSTPESSANAPFPSAASKVAAHVSADVPDAFSVDSGAVAEPYLIETDGAEERNPSQHEMASPMGEFAPALGEVASSLIQTAESEPEAAAKTDTAAADDFLDRSPSDLLVDPLDIAPADDLEPAPRFVQAAAPARTPEQDIKLSFLRQDGPPPVRTSRASRWLWGCMGVLLTLALVAQWVVFERDRIVASEPGLRPVVELVCQTLGCTVGPLRQIESIVIDSSAFTKVNGDVYRLTCVLKSSASVELAAPSLELSVTDSQDQPLVRHVLHPAELGNKSGTLTPNGEWVVAVSMTVKQPSGTERIAGYRLLAFYP